MLADPGSQLLRNQLSILVVDDYHEMVMTIRRMLLQLGFPNSSEARNGSEALSLVKRGNYHLVISDLRMQKMDGMALLSEIRADPKLKDLPFIMVTAAGEFERVAAARTAGVTDYIVKPFAVATLKTKMTGTLDRMWEFKRACDRLRAL